MSALTDKPDEKQKPGLLRRWFGAGAAPAPEAGVDAAPEAPGAPPPKRSWWRRLTEGLAKSSSQLSRGVADIFTKRKLDAAALDDLEDLLLQADLGVAASSRIRALVGKGRYDKEIEPDEVKSFLMDEVCLSEGMATQEMQRYVFRGPGQATSYFYGYQRLMETRQAAQLALRQRFNRREFNDFVLAQGLLPPRLLRKAVMDDFVPAHLPH